MNEIEATYRRGADFVFGIAPIPPALASAVSSVVANAKPAVGRFEVPPASTAETFDWVPVERAAQGDIPAGWDLILLAEDSVEVPPGIYCTTIELNFVGGGKNREKPFFFEVEEVTL